MTATDLIGYLASALVLAAFCMRNMTVLRGVAIASNVAFICYGAMADLGPVLALHLLLLPINMLRMMSSPSSKSTPQAHRPPPRQRLAARKP